jgi:hypothetical protein
VVANGNRPLAVKNAKRRKGKMKNEVWTKNHPSLSKLVRNKKVEVLDKRGDATHGYQYLCRVRKLNIWIDGRYILEDSR